jgi:protein SCO1
MRPWLRTAIGLLIVSAFWAMALILIIGSKREPPSAPRADGLRGSLLPPGVDKRPAFPLDLEDARGGRISAQQLRGEPYVVTFLYTQCPDVCPVIGQEIKQALSLLGPDGQRVTAVAVSVDPRGDTQASVREWLDRQRMPVNFRYAIGTQAQLEPVWNAYYAAPQQPGRPETSLHTATMWIVDGKGRLRTRWPAGQPVAPEDLAADLRTLLDES